MLRERGERTHSRRRCYGICQRARLVGFTYIFSINYFIARAHYRTRMQRIETEWVAL